MHQRAPFETRALDVRPLQDVKGLDRWDRSNSGRWQCELEVITSLCIKSAFDRQAGAKTVLIPGSSLRGMVRNAAEILGAGCGRLYSGGRELPVELSPCKDTGTCVVCRVFGFVDGKTTWQSRVRFSDATSVGEVRWQRLDAEARSGRGGSDPEREQGWAVFVHRDEEPSSGRVPCVAPGAKFRFGVEFAGLDETEYAVFRLALTLHAGQHRLVHKLGFAKSLGFGSCEVVILNEGEIKDAVRREAVTKATERYAALGGFQELVKWRTEER